MKRSLILLLFLGCCCLSKGYSQESLQMAFWNVENYFDTQHDTLKEDYAFTPSGDNHWSYPRYLLKRNNIYKTIAAMQWPAVVGLAEVENDKVLRDLCKGTPLRQFGYDFVHYDSPDARGVDCALLFRSDAFRIIDSKPICVSDSTTEFYTRDILMVHGILGSLKHHDTCFLFVNHWPSKLGGAVADMHRMRISETLFHFMDSLQRNHPTALILAMGDFNASQEEASIDAGLKFHGLSQNAAGFYNLLFHHPQDIGSYKYQGQWSCIDQMICNRELPIEIFYTEWMLSDDEKYMGKKPFRTYSGIQYLGGYSDHLPIMVTIKQ